MSDSGWSCPATSERAKGENRNPEKEANGNWNPDRDLVLDDGGDAFPALDHSAF